MRLKARTKGDSWEIKELEELKNKVKPKIFKASKELTDVANIFKNFCNKHQNGGKTVFAKKLEFYLNELEFDH